MKGELIRRADIMAGLTSAEMQKKLKQGTGEEAYSAFLDIINSSPAADAVEVVRCGNCEYRFTDYRCQGRRPDWFCPNGKRSSFPWPHEND